MIRLLVCANIKNTYLVHFTSTSKQLNKIQFHLISKQRQEVEGEDLQMKITFYYRCHYNKQ